MRHDLIQVFTVGLATPTCLVLASRLILFPYRIISSLMLLVHSFS
jgi:hypothetical protein